VLLWRLNLHTKWGWEEKGCGVGDPPCANKIIINNRLSWDIQQRWTWVWSTNVVLSYVQQWQFWDPWHFGVDPDPHLWLMDPTPNPTPFLSDFKDAKIFLFIFFLIIYPQGQYLQSYEKKEGSGARARSCGPKNLRIPDLVSDPDPQHWTGDFNSRPPDQEYNALIKELFEPVEIV
jgi:hypothetical protein